MPFGISYLELAAILVVAIVACAMYFARVPQYRWCFVALGCVTLAAVLTPADLLSTLLLAAAFAAVYFAGTRHPRLRSTA
jgi:Sec-independent protein secretion pathway component TatC